jgi:UDP-N-acetylmuramate--alanine ligase
MLSEVSRLKYCLAIAGTHGKTTTTSMCGLVMMKAGMDPTVIVGGKLKGLGGSNARLGHGDWIVLEADEYDRSFLQLLPTIAIITNVEADHLDIYSDLDDIKEAFCEFTNKVPFYGTACVCIDDEGVRDILPSISRVVMTFGTSDDATVRATNIVYTQRNTTFTLTVNGVDRGEIMLHVPGEHNVRNALAACAMALRCGIAFEMIRDGLADFGGVYRRFELRGERNGVLVIDDYAHHPTEIRATIDAARNGWPGRRVVAVFQPHTYTRTRDFVDEFASACAEADVVVLTDVYAAREQPIPGITGELLATAARALGHSSVHYVPNVVDVAGQISGMLQPGDVVLTMGAGDIHKVATALVD